MVFSINRVTLLGRCAQDPELRYTADGTPVCTVNIATSHSYQQDGEWKEVAEFTRCVLWRKAAEYVAQNLSKGSYLYVDGRLQTRKWQDAEGQTRYTTEVVVRNYVIPREVGKPPMVAEGNEELSDFSSNKGKVSRSEEVSEEDIPF